VKRVLVVTKKFPPAFDASVPRTLRFVRYLSEFGWEPLVFTQSAQDGSELESWLKDLTVFRRPTGEQMKASSSAKRLPPKIKEKEKRSIPAMGSLEALARNTWDLLTETPDKTAAWSRSSTADAVSFAQEHGVSAIYTTGPPHSLHLLGRRLQDRLRIPWVADFRDPWSRRPWGHKPANPWGQRLHWWFESAAVRSADVVILNTERMADEFRLYYSDLPSDRFIAIPNGCDPALADGISKLIESNESSTRDGDVVRLLHPGSLYRQRDPRPIVDALVRLHQQGLRVAFEQVGACHADFRLEEYIRENNLSQWVSVEPPVPHEEILKRMAAAEVLLLLQPGTDLQVPGKLFEMLQFRKPILALTGTGATADLIERYQLGAVACSQDASEIASALQTIVEERSRAASAARWDEACRDFDGRTLTRRLADVLSLASGATDNIVVNQPSEIPARLEEPVNANG